MPRTKEVKMIGPEEMGDPKTLKEIDKDTVNRSGMTFAEWAYAAGLDPTTASWQSKVAWTRQIDPAEFRVALPMTDEENAGVQAIQTLQKMAGVYETTEESLTAWRSMQEWERKQTMNVAASLKKAG